MINRRLWLCLLPWAPSKSSVRALSRKRLRLIESLDSKHESRLLKEAIAADWRPWFIGSGKGGSGACAAATTARVACSATLELEPRVRRDQVPRAIRTFMQETLSAWGGKLAAVKLADWAAADPDREKLFRRRAASALFDPFEAPY
ncbi:hypothetical protein EAS62_39695 [Bradyrhizobium zhanjiangense]|uniref:Uncharacterized protein n=1 Tax=Bradyrhizobium zhanjiangense TaxID=1325107 RepID=A0ABY0D9P2_9BRAD|nr:hypothetical protein EAS62_39695 [Bradyrhizobium zhanjiangense]